MKQKISKCINNILDNSFASKLICFFTKIKNIKNITLVISSFVILVLTLIVVIDSSLCGRTAEVAYNNLSQLNNQYNSTNRDYEIMYDVTEPTFISYVNDLNLENNNNLNKISKEENNTTAVKVTLKRQQVMSTQVKSSIDVPVNKNTVEYTLNSSAVKISEKDIKALERIVASEANTEDLIGKILIANVVLNRVRSNRFPATIYDVVFQENQFSPIDDGRFFSIGISNSIKEAVSRALNGEDYSKGALYFAARRAASKHAMSWFDAKLERLFQHGAHEFFK